MFVASIMLTLFQTYAYGGFQHLVTKVLNQSDPKQYAKKTNKQKKKKNNPYIHGRCIPNLVDTASDVTTLFLFEN